MIGRLLPLIGRRLLMIVPLLLIVTMITFSLVLLIPGDPAARIAGEAATAQQVAQVRTDLGLDKSVPVRYLSFVYDTVRGDLGTSYTFHTPIRQMLAERLPVTLSLTLVAMVMAVLVGIPVGVLAARRKGRWQDKAVTVGSTLGLATPNFVLAMMLVLFLAIKTQVLPATGYQPMSAGLDQWLKHLILPGTALGLVAAAEIGRQLRSSMVHTLQQEYIRTATAKGMRSRTVVWRHALKNALMPVVTVVGMQVGYMLGGTAVIESVFGIKGLGDFAVQAVLNSDLPAIQGMVILAVSVTVLASLVVDISYAYLNPRGENR